MIFKYSDKSVRGSLVIYFVLAYFITWILTLPLVLSARSLIALKISEHWHFLGAFGPIGAAFLTVRFINGNSISGFIKKLIHNRVGIIWYLVSIFSPFVLFLLSVMILRIFNNSWPDFSRLTLSKYLNFTWIGGSLLSAFAYGIGEEVGWRGFALPRLQYKYSALLATFLLSIFWAVWHLPMFFYRFDFGMTQIIGFFIGLFAGAIWLTFLFNSTGGNILTVIFWHISWNLVNIIGLVVSVEVVSLMSSMIIVIAIIIVIIEGPKKLSYLDKYVTAVD